MNKPHRGTIFVEDANILAHDAFAGEQYILRVHAPRCAQSAEPGSFAHIQCDPLLPLRRPLSIMRSDPRAGWVEFLYKAVGEGTRLLARRTVGETLSIMGPIGKPFQPHGDRPLALLLGGGVGIPPMVFLASMLRTNPVYQPVVFMGSEAPFPFKTRPSGIMLPGMPDGVIATMPLLEDWGVPCRLTSLSDFPGCHEGYVTDLARLWLDALEGPARHRVEIFACGPHPMLEACARLAAEYHVPCQVSLEEFMACAVGGCAGCVVEVKTEQGPAMKRVCVDGPVFDAKTVF
jgi:dihydroorotate dehydrogenase electron transfer subunit